MTHGAFIAREKCGCVVAAFWDEDDDCLAETVLGWARDGYIINYEQRESIGAEKCPQHSVERPIA